MGIKVALHHRTEYRYERAVSLGPQTIQLRPAPHCRTPILSYALAVTPAENTLRWQFDALGNQVARVNIPGRTPSFVTEVDLVADLAPINPFAFTLEPGYEQYPFVYSPELTRDLEPYRASADVEPTGPRLQRFLASLPVGTQPTVTFLVNLNQRVRDEVSYNVRLEHGVQTCEQTLGEGSGSCRDSSWLLVQICRQLGFAARFVSGYLIQLADGEDVAGAWSGPLVDSADLHAWAEVFLPGAGWVGMDPTSGLLTAEGHIPLACTPTPAQAAPIGGTVEPARVDFSYAMSVRRLNAAAPLTQPYTEAEWNAVRGVAHAVDRDLQAQDVRLTMGGEPTFVGIDETESPQWNIDALGPLKRTRGLALLRSLRERTAPGALLHLGQGKWYPGEPLPRWAFQCISRVDGVAVWENGNLFALEDQAYGFTEADALRFLEALSRRLGASTGNILPAFNYNAPADHYAPDLPAGYVLPLRRRPRAGKLAWSSQLWFARPDRLVLSLGDSPVGYRIPVEPMPWVAPDELTYEHENGHDGPLVAGQEKLAPHPARHPERFAQEPFPDPLPPVPDTAATATILIRPSLCVEVREGRMHVFLPFVPVLADYLDLVAAVEDTCQYLRMPVWIEGYPAPADARLRNFGLTPDPGVLEVNLPATSAWDDLEELNRVLSEEARNHRLIASKFAYDGGQLATGGGSHITIGGPGLADSPVLRRPDLLRSMITFWQNHPSLSYLFSGMYVGPTSQYPRVDEARTDALYELDLSFSHLPRQGCPPHILDGLLRNLLVDVTGNTHRAEFCIDKLYPPEGTGLRLGLLELRAFEMAPHYRMGLLQMLLVRALVCVFWRQPFEGELLRWGAALHDRFMLAHFVQRDFFEVLSFLRRHGYDFQESWFAAHFEFRFPKIGSVTLGSITPGSVTTGAANTDSVELELRQALEPWNVLAEETTAGGTGRSVDSSLERMQVKLTGLASTTRYVVACNGRKVPLHATEKPGEAIAGIRYRARRLSMTLHPTIPVHTPLRLQLLDTWTGRCVADCTYFAGPPDGTVHTTRPNNAEEARARRLQRFQVASPSEVAFTLPADESNPVFPMTLDLRWPSPAERALQDLPGLDAPDLLPLGDSAASGEP